MKRPLDFLLGYPFIERRDPPVRCWRLPWRPFGIGHPWDVVVHQWSTPRELYQCACGRWLKLGPSRGPWRVWRWR